MQIKIISNKKINNFSICNINNNNKIFIMKKIVTMKIINLKIII